MIDTFSQFGNRLRHIYNEKATQKSGHPFKLHGCIFFVTKTKIPLSSNHSRNPRFHIKWSR